jgi:hypothetical protein
VRKPWPARAPGAPALPPRPRPRPPAPLSTAPHPPPPHTHTPPHPRARASACPPRRPRSTFHRHRSWQFLQDPLFLWELKERAPMAASIGSNAMGYLTHHRLHEQHPACRRKSLLHQRRQRGAALPLGRPSSMGPARRPSASRKLTAVSMSSSMRARSLLSPCSTATKTLPSTT